MSKRPRNSQAPASTSEGLAKHLKAAGNDVELLQEIIDRNDSGAVAAAFAALLAGGGPSSPNASRLREKASESACPLLSAKALLEVVLFADRDTVDAMQDVCSFMHNFISERELTQLALRPISEAEITVCRDLAKNYYNHFDGWEPIVELVYSHGAGNKISPKTVDELASCLHMAFCRSVCIDIAGVVGLVNKPYEELTDYACDMVFNDLDAPNTFVGTLTIRIPCCNVEIALRGIEAFGHVSSVIVESDEKDRDPGHLGENFFGTAAQRGVRRIKFDADDESETPADTAAALSFGFAEPAAGGDREVLGVACEVGADFLAQVKQRVAEVDGARDVDFNFKLANVSAPIDSTGFEQYQRADGRAWLIDDFENHVNVEIKQAEKHIEIHVFSSV
ncbi:hypothetical protein AAVH_30012 [Aphelenchoides avenae]|nr:hypothetical protein AAVH_30012 [Aphelenchus avenae]